MNSKSKSFDANQQTQNYAHGLMYESSVCSIRSSLATAKADCSILFKKLKRIENNAILPWILWRWRGRLWRCKIRKISINLDFLYEWSLVYFTFPCFRFVFLGMHVLSFIVISFFRCSIFVSRSSLCFCFSLFLLNHNFLLHHQLPSRHFHEVHSRLFVQLNRCFLVIEICLFH